MQNLQPSSMFAFQFGQIAIRIHGEDSIVSINIFHKAFIDCVLRFYAKGRVDFWTMRGATYTLGSPGLGLQLATMLGGGTCVD